MKNRILAIGPEEIARIKAAVAYADAHRVTFETLLHIRVGLARPPGDDPRFVTMIPFGYRCVFTIEKQPMGWCRHLSVSVPNGRGLCPNPLAVDEIMKHFGFRPTPSEHKMWLEKEQSAVNLLETLEQPK